MAVAGFNYTKVLTASYQQQPGRSAVRRTQMSDGIAKQAKRFSKTYIRHSMTYLLTNAQYTAFKTWWKDTAEFGALAFDFANPQSGSTVDGRVVDGMYDARPYDSEFDYWAITMTVETLE